ncbi:hypothetical protein GCM10007941_13990 [Amphritea balenae]|nr:hypothetical protein GCM10007941_13990 [Amphritea balenae]
MRQLKKNSLETGWNIRLNADTKKPAQAGFFRIRLLLTYKSGLLAAFGAFAIQIQSAVGNFKAQLLGNLILTLLQ